MAALSKKQEVPIEGRSVTLSNLDKVLHPAGFTEGQVIDHYIHLSD